METIFHTFAASCWKFGTNSGLWRREAKRFVESDRTWPCNGDPMISVRARPDLSARSRRVHPAVERRQGDTTSPGSVIRESVRCPRGKPQVQNSLRASTVALLYCAGRDTVFGFNTGLGSIEPCTNGYLTADKVEHKVRQRAGVRLR